MIGNEPLDRQAATDLELAISDTSQRCFLSAWALDIEFSLWAIVASGKPGALGKGMVTEADIERLRDLSRRSRGWCTWPRTKRGPEFLRFHQWNRLLTEKQEAAIKLTEPKGKPR